MEVNYCKIYECVCSRVLEKTKNAQDCNMKCSDCKNKKVVIRGQRAKANFYEDISLMYDKKQVDEVLDKFINKDNKIDFEKEYECIWIGSDKS